MMTVYISKYPRKKLYLNDELVSEYYGPTDVRNYGEVEITDNILRLSGVEYVGVAWVGYDHNDTEVIQFITGDRLNNG